MNTSIANQGSKRLWGVPNVFVGLHSPRASKHEIPALLRSLTAARRVPGIPHVPIKALARHVGVDRRTLYKLMDGEPCSDAFAERLLYVLGKIHAGDLIFDQEHGGPWQARHLESGEIPPRPQARVLAGSVEFTSSGPRLRFLRF